MFRYKLRTLLILLAVMPPIIGGGFWLWEGGTPPDPTGVLVVSMNGFVNKDGVAYWERRERKRNGTVDVTIYRRDGEEPPPQDD